MRLLRAVAGTLLWIVAVVLGLVGAILCVTIILIPVGLAVLGYARRLFTSATKLMAPKTTSRASEGAESARRLVRRSSRSSGSSKRATKAKR